MILDLHISIQLLIMIITIALLVFSLLRLNKYYTQGLIILTSVVFMLTEQLFLFTLIALEVLVLFCYFVIKRMIKYVRRRNEINEKFLAYVEEKDENSYH